MNPWWMNWEAARTGRKHSQQRVGEARGHAALPGSIRRQSISPQGTEATVADHAPHKHGDDRPVFMPGPCLEPHDHLRMKPYAGGSESGAWFCKDVCTAARQRSIGGERAVLLCSVNREYNKRAGSAGNEYHVREQLPSTSTKISTKPSKTTDDATTEAPLSN